MKRKVRFTLKHLILFFLVLGLGCSFVARQIHLFNGEVYAVEVLSAKYSCICTIDGATAGPIWDIRMLLNGRLFRPCRFLIARGNNKYDQHFQSRMMQLVNLESIVLYETQERADQCELDFCKFSRLKKLSVFGRLSPDELLSAVGCSRLVELELASCGLEFGHSEVLRQFLQVKSLDLSENPKIDEAFVSQLRRLTGLEKLLLADTRVSGKKANEWPGGLHLKSLNCDGTLIDDHSIKSICNKFLKMEVLSIRDTNVTDKSVSAFKDHPSLRLLIVDGCNISDSGIRAIEKTQRVETRRYGVTTSPQESE